MKLREITDWPIILIKKIKTISEDGTQRETLHKIVHGDPKGKRIIFVDDMTSSGRTDMNSIIAYIEAGAEEIIIFTPHPVFVADYKSRIEKMLGYPQVKLFIVTNSIPFSRPGGERKDIPGIGFGRKRKTVDVILINNLYLTAASAILRTPTLAEAANLIGHDHIWVMRDPYEMATELTGQKFERPTIVRIYEGEGVTRPLPEKKIKETVIFQR